MSFPSNLIEFQDRFPDEESCWRHLREVRWPAGFECPRCGEQESHFIRTRRLEPCRRCRYQASVTDGTIFHRTRKPLRVWFLGVFFLARHKTGISALQFQKDAGIGNYQTAWTMLHKLRSALGPRPEDKLTGLVEVDESTIGGKEPGLRGGRRLVGKTLVAGAVEHREHTAGRLRLAVLRGLTFQNDLGPFVCRSVQTTPRYAPMRFKATAVSGRSGSITNGSFRARTLPDRLRSFRGFIASSETSRRGCAERSMA